jgi:transposase
MSVEDEIEDLARRLVIRRKRDGRSVYEPGAKRELIEACARPDVSVAKVARACGINASQLGNWVRQHERAKIGAAATDHAIVEKVEPAFVPMQIESAVSPSIESALELQARLPNGVVIELRCQDLQQAGKLVEALGRLRCSASTKG